MATGKSYDLAVVMKGIKGTSSREINVLFGTKESVWQKESHDRLIRREGEFHEKRTYIRWNPCRAGLVTFPEDFPFFVEHPAESWF